MADNDYFKSGSGALRASGAGMSKKDYENLQKKLNMRVEKLEYIPQSRWTNLRWNRRARWTLSYILIAIALISNVFNIAPKLPMNAVHGFQALDVKPGSVPVFSRDNELKGFLPSDKTQRTLFASIPGGGPDSDEMRELAYQLYEIGNLGMMVADHSAYYSSGLSISTIIGTDMKLSFEVIDIRDNLSGAAFRQRYQSISKSASDLETLMAIFARPEIAERRHYIAGEQKVDYEFTKKFNEDEVSGERTPDWSSLSKLSELGSREKRVQAPIPFTAAALKNGNAGLGSEIYGDWGLEYKTVGEFYGNKYNHIFGDISDIYIPVYLDCYDLRAARQQRGRYITYEKTDQHVFFDADGDDFYNTIRSANVTYEADGFYKVVIVLDFSTGYASADTRYSITDEMGSRDSKANFESITIEFELWDNGYFKKWKMIEQWSASKAYGFASIVARQDYTEHFTYYAPDCDLTRFAFWE